MQIAIKLRLRDEHAVGLNAQARAVGFDWNYCNEGPAARTQHPLGITRLLALTAGSAEGLDLAFPTRINSLSRPHKIRKQYKKRWLRFRSRKSLGWVPFNTRHVSFDGEALTVGSRDEYAAAGSDEVIGLHSNDHGRSAGSQ